MGCAEIQAREAIAPIAEPQPACQLMGKPPETLVSKNDNRASVPESERRLFATLLPLTCDFFMCPPRDGKARGGSRRDGSKGLSHVDDGFGVQCRLAAHADTFAIYHGVNDAAA